MLGVHKLEPSEKWARTVAIGHAAQRGPLGYVYAPQGRQLVVIGVGGNQIGEGLKGDTSGTVSVQRGSLLLTYDEKGRQRSVTSAL